MGKETEMTLEDIIDQISYHETYVCGMEHDDDHLFVPSDPPVMCDVCGWIRPNSGILTDAQYAVNTLSIVVHEGLYRFMIKNDMKRITPDQVLQCMLQGVIQQDDLWEVHAALQSIELRLVKDHPGTHTVTTHAHPGECDVCGWIDHSTMSFLSGETLRRYISVWLVGMKTLQDAFLTGISVSILEYLSIMGMELEGDSTYGHSN